MPSYNEMSRTYRFMFFWEIKYIRDNLEKIERIRAFARNLDNTGYLYFQNQIYPERVTHLPAIVSGLLCQIDAQRFLWRNPNKEGTQWNGPDMTDADLHYITGNNGNKGIAYFNENIGSAALFLGTGWAKARELKQRNQPIDWDDLADSVATARYELKICYPSWLNKYVGSRADDLAKLCLKYEIPEDRLKPSLDNPVYRGIPQKVS